MAEKRHQAFHIRFIDVFETPMKYLDQDALVFIDPIVAVVRVFF